ncbi:TKL protein kinase [Phytophthora nicotianae CJ01A1]|uniref:TKL protein kinase n=6 Tax=Phytophthora nicotianae TaxID=4792 RepID=W2QP75_PHYN3|nr:TKL protein kinase [Phytophthora nicotianae INRA-310]ETI53996.1 TKL protein kinase [Phytophthora nicotianae P1569]ETK93837.1 TKL protein kinase [Phytophthora nicotianae]ETO82679.1 TKL protein kinase [Phytophthora nicotianae P1976]ETP23799.1 TKL protein kinase [Phytophthora nicotianae CJ01A1]ETP51780.1 TKL protein kinase [Phytophthora nicotianae P10297]
MLYVAVVVSSLLPLLAVAQDDQVSYEVSLSTGALIGIVAGCVVALLLLICCCCYTRKRRRAKRKRELEEAVAAAIIHTPKTGDSHAIDVPYEQHRQHNTGSTYTGSTTHPHRSGNTYGGDPNSSTTGSGGRHSISLWDDPVIVAARIPFDRVELGELLSRGGFGEVYRGRYRDQNVAVKTLLPSTRKDMNHIEAFLAEIKLMATMEHPQIVQFIGVAWESLSELYAISEFMEGGDLRTLLVKHYENGHPRGFEPAKIKMALQVAHALTYLHSLDPIVLHRDLKSRNILLTESLDAKITDFGASRERSDKTMTAGVGTSFWMAPEVVMGERYGEKADVFSFGVVLSELDTHELPYSHAKENSETSRPLPDTAVLQLVLMGRLQVQFSGVGPIEMTELARQCLQIEPQDRPTAAEVLYRLHTISKQYPSSYAL